MLINDFLKPAGARDDILAVAARLFSEGGFANVSIRDICETAGVTPPTVYYYFGNKGKLFQAVIRRMLSLADFRASLIEALGEHPDPKGRLEIFIDHYLAYFPRGFFNPGMFLESSTKLYDVSTERVMSEFEVINRLAREIIRDGVTNGQFKDIDADKATEYLMNLLMSYVLGEVHYRQFHEPGETAKFICDLFLNGLSNQHIPD